MDQNINNTNYQMQKSTVSKVQKAAELITKTRKRAQTDSFTNKISGIRHF